MHRCRVCPSGPLTGKRLASPLTSRSGAAHAAISAATGWKQASRRPVSVVDQRRALAAAPFGRRTDSAAHRHSLAAGPTAAARHRGSRQRPAPGTGRAADDARHRLQQAQRVGMARRGERAPRTRLLDDAAGIHDGDALGGFGHHRQIMVMRIVAMPISAWSRGSSSRICAWVVTSSAVVGSSAISSSGPQASAIAIITRWRMPPDIDADIRVSRRSGFGDAHPGEQRSTRCCAARPRSMPRCSSQRLGHLLPHPHRRVERGHRLLEDHGDSVAPDLLAAGVRWRPRGPRH